MITNRNASDGDDLRTWATKMNHTVKNYHDRYQFPLTVKRLKELIQVVLEKYEDYDVIRPPLTPAQEKVLEAIKDDFKDGSQPTVRSISDRVGNSSINSVQGHINNLIQLGYITREGSRKQIILVND